MSAEIADYQQVIRSDEILPGDYLYRSLPKRYSGPRGDRYVVRGSELMCRVHSFDPETGLLLTSDAGKVSNFPLRLRYRDVPVVIKRRDSAGGSRPLSADDLLQRAIDLEAAQERSDNVADLGRQIAMLLRLAERLETPDGRKAITDDEIRALGLGV